MNEERLRELLSAVQKGEASVPDAVQALRQLPFSDLGFARVDQHRTLRCGFPEVIFAEQKTVQETVEISSAILEQGHALLVTRVRDEQVTALQQLNPDLVFHERARLLSTALPEPLPNTAPMAVLAAGTSDLQVAEEARITAAMFGREVRSLYDVGVAGLHRLLPELSWLQQMSVLVVVAGMDGALPSVVGGLVSCPVIAVPTSVGYGASFGGVAALLTMLNSCSSGVVVVNIDNGFGAGYAAALMNRVQS